MSKKIDLTGRRFGRLVVLEQGSYITPGRPRWRCRCVCGKETIVSSASLLYGNTTSCGCYRREKQAESGKHHTTHGMSKDRLYYIYYGMRRRCYNPNAIDFPRYGGRGIKICEDWLHSFECFKEWAFSNGYDESLSIDRIDCNGDYCPENCRWTDLKTQHNNTRKNHYVTYEGETLTISQWAERYGINKITLQSRLCKYGWSVERALTKGGVTGG